MRQIFTLTAGRTGSAWLEIFLRENLKCVSAHELLEIEDFGVRMPDIKTMRTFNHYGNNEFVQSFWHRKFATISNDHYAETNHALGKCGLIENLILQGREKFSTIIVLKRNLKKQCASYLLRGDFFNRTVAWQWYLHPQYPRVLIDPKPFEELGPFFLPVWYCLEFDARQRYYYQRFSGQIEMIETTLEALSSSPEAERVLAILGSEGPPKVPEKTNVNDMILNDENLERLDLIFDNLEGRFDKVVDVAISRGFRF